MKLENGMNIECNSEQEAKDFIKEAYNQGFKWVNHENGDEYLTMWNESVKSIEHSLTVEDKSPRIYYILRKNLITWNTYKTNFVKYSDLVKEENKPFSKSDLQNGMIVQIKSGHKYLVHNEKLLNAHQASSGKELIRKILLAGEITSLTRIVLELSGFTSSVSEVEVIKN